MIRLSSRPALLLSITILPLCASAQGMKVDDIGTLPITTSGFGNTLMRGWGENPEPSAQRWVMNYFSALTASPDGIVFCVTNYEEGQQKVGVYRDGDNLPDGNSLTIPTRFSPRKTTSSWARVGKVKS